MKMSVRDQLPVAISDCHQLLGWLIPQLDQFLRVRRFTLGEKLGELVGDAHPTEFGVAPVRDMSNRNSRVAIGHHKNGLDHMLKPSRPTQ